MASSKPTGNPTYKPTGAATGTCPICNRPTEHDYRPFCSRRCADVDLSRWLRGTYAIPDVAESEDGDGAEQAEQVEEGEGDRRKR